MVIHAPLFWAFVKIFINTFIIDFIGIKILAVLGINIAQAL